MRKIYLVLGCFLMTHVIWSQTYIRDADVTDYVEITLKEGTQIKGIINEMSLDYLVVSSESLGELKILIKDIQSFEILSEEEYYDPTSGYFDNPQPNKNYLTETAIGLDQGEGLYQNILLGGHVFSYGITDNFDLGGGFEAFSLFSGNSPSLFISPKFTFPNKKENLHFGIGSNLIWIPESGGYLAGSVYGITTFGSVNNNFTIGAGFVFSSDGFEESPAIQLGGMLRIGKTLMLVSDHIVIIDQYSSGVGGSWTFRFITPTVSIDVGAVVLYEGGVLPLLGASIKL